MNGNRDGSGSARTGLLRVIFLAGAAMVSFGSLALAQAPGGGAGGGAADATPAQAGAAGAGPGAAAAQQESAEPAEPVWSWDPSDPRLRLRPGSRGYVGRGLELVAAMPRPEGFATNSDLGFRGNHVYVGNYRGINIYDITDPTAPRLRLSLLCPGSQGDVSIYRHLLFKSDQATSARLDCGTEPPEGRVNPDRFQGVRIFDISDLDNPRQVAAVQACRGSHTHSLATHPDDPDHVYVYIQGTNRVRPAEELPGCSGAGPDDPETSLFQIEVVRVPLAAPHEARIVNEPRVFADRETGAVAGLRSQNRQGEPGSATSSCHDITTYPAIGLAGGACAGNGLLLDISDVVNPVRIDEVADRNFSYWHSATFNNDGTKVVFTDEWGGGGAPRCRAIDPPIWGGNAIFDIVDRKLVHRSYYKLPVPVTATCVAHNGSLIPVPGRDIKVQAWYNGGISVFDFTDSENPFEIAFFARAPGSGSSYWSAYWYNGYVYGSAGTLDVLRLVPNEHLSANEIEAAMAVVLEEFNPQHQPRFSWPAIPAVSRSYIDQLVRARAIDADFAATLAGQIAYFDRSTGRERDEAAEQLLASAARIEAEALAALTAGQTGNPTRVRALLASSLRELAATR